MIIQCKQCRTKFRFDDVLMEEDGVWMRCNHCQHVFFQDNPQAQKTDSESAVNKEAASSEEPVLLQNVSQVSPATASSSGGDEDVASFLNNVMNADKNLNKELAFEIDRPAVGKNRVREAIDAAKLSVEDEDMPEEERVPRKSFWKVLKVAIWILLVVVIIPAVIYFFVFPQVGDSLLKIANKYIGIGMQEPPRPEVVIGEVKLQDIRQRILNNYVLGQIRIVEGTAVNQADYPISRIVIKGEIVDAYAVVLGEHASYAGNVLTDEELTTLPQDEILRRLSQREGRNNSNDRIMPTGQIPFMIVFAREPSGVIKTTVTTIGAERLL
jgi:predicted Zn finger-like uncharacterized protein